MKAKLDPRFRVLTEVDSAKQHSMALASSTSRDRYKPTRRHVVTALFATALLVSPASVAVFVHKQTTFKGNPLGTNNRKSVA